jgi:hypothetical protein
MEDVAEQRRLISQIFSEYAEFISEDPSVETALVMDEVRGHYMLLFLGWHGVERELLVHVYVRLHNGKYWIEEDGTEFGIARKLTEHGVARSDIVLAFQTPQERSFGEFAVT